MGLLSFLNKGAGGTYQNNFFSIAGQKERIQNVGAVLNASFNPLAKNKDIKANTGSETVNKILETVAEHPYISSGVAAGAITTVSNPTAALNIAKTLIPKSVPGKIAAAAAIPIVAGYVIESPINSASTAIAAPSKLFDVGKDLGAFKSEPSLSAGIAFVKEHPYFTTSALITALAGLGYTSATILSLINNYRNTDAVQDNTKAVKESQTVNVGSGYNSTGYSAGGDQPIIINNYTQPTTLPTPQTVGESAMVATAAKSTTSKPKKKKSTKKKSKKSTTKKKSSKKTTKKKQTKKNKKGRR